MGMSYDTSRNTAQPAFQVGRNPATAPITSAAVQNPGAANLGQSGVPALQQTPQPGSVAPAGGLPPPAAGAFAMPGQTIPWGQGGNPVIQQALMQQGGGSGAFSSSGMNNSLLSAPVVRFGGGR